MKKLETRRATASDVAKLAGVSKWTVSRAFTPGASVSEQAREAVLAAAERLGYRPNLLARSLSKKSTRMIGVAIDEMKNPHSMQLLDAVSRQLQMRGYMALLLNVTAGEDYRAAMQLADQLQVDGILFTGTVLTEELYALATDLHHIPLVQVGRYATEPGIDAVNIDGWQAGREIGELLLAQGYRRFGYMKGPDTSTGHLLRMEGFREALQSAGYDIDLLLTAGHYDRTLAYKCLEDYLSACPAEARVEAMFCENDILALGAMEKLRESGTQMGIVGFDDIDEASLPGWQLTSYSQGSERLINEALNRLIDGQVDEQGDWRQGKLLIRASHLKK